MECVYSLGKQSPRNTDSVFVIYRKKEDSILFLWYRRNAFGETLSDWATVRYILSGCLNDWRTEILITFRFLMTLTMISYVLTIFTSSYYKRVFAVSAYVLCSSSSCILRRLYSIIITKRFCFIVPGKWKQKLSTNISFYCLMTLISFNNMFRINISPFSSFCPTIHPKCYVSEVSWNEFNLELEGENLWLNGDCATNLMTLKRM